MEQFETSKIDEGAPLESHVVLPTTLPAPDNHFDDIHDYDAEIPEHMRLHYLAKKVGIMNRWISKYAPVTVQSVLDIGCGTGWHLDALGAPGRRLVGLDSSARQLSKVKDRKNSIEAVLGSAESLPFPDGSFDVVFSINTLHHLPSVSAQKQALSEIKRVLKTGGLFMVHEINVRNPVINFYMNHVFPKLRNIDTGEEIWLTVPALQQTLGRAIDCEYYTFLPDWAPQSVLPIGKTLESLLERTPLSIFGAHLSAAFRKE